jgi:MOSC domain-containing protein YiiM
LRAGTKARDDRSLHKSIRLLPELPMWSGTVEHLHIAPRAFLPVKAQEQITLVAGRGIEGDRYIHGAGFYSHIVEEGRQISLFEIETIEALKRDHGVDLLPEDHRRNITTRGVPLNHLVNKRFWVGGVLLEATRLSTPCKHIEEITGKGIFNFILNRAGLNAKIVQGGTVRVGDTIKPD